MKDNLFDIRIALARPDVYKISTDFTDRVMIAIASPEILSVHVRKMSVNKKETLMMKFRHLPKFAIIAIAFGAFLFLAGTAYAVVQTITNVKVDQSGTNEFGREQLSVTFDGCADQWKRGTTYEIKRGSNLSAVDGAKVLEARCQLDAAGKWIDNDSQASQALGGVPGIVSFMTEADTVMSVDEDSINLKLGGEKPLPQSTRFVENSQTVARSTVKKGDTVIYYSPHLYAFPFQNGDLDKDLVVFKLPLSAKYYNLDYQSYITSRGPCVSNPSRVCLVASNINSTVLIVEYGAAVHTLDETEDTKQVQGLVVSYDSRSIKIDVGDGVIYTLETPHNVVDRYNSLTVYGLAKLDGIYANTDPEALKIKIGDSLDIYYLEAGGESTHTIMWEKILTVGLMVERIPNSLQILRKY